MSRFKVEIVRPECSGCELCTTICEDLFEMASDGLSTLKDGHRVGDNDEQEIDDAECAKSAAADCPVSCIHVYDGANKIL